MPAKGNDSGLRFFHSQIQRTIFTRGILAIILFGVLLLHCRLAWKYLAPNFLCSNPINSGDFLESAFLQPGCLVEVQPDMIQELFPYSYTYGKKPYRVFGYVKLGNQVAVVRMPPGLPRGRFKGTLEPLTVLEKKLIVPWLEGYEPGCRVSRFRLDMVTPLFWWICRLNLAILVVLVAAMAWCLYNLLLLTLKPERHPIFLSLQRFGSPRALAREIQQEINQPATQKLGRLYLTENWVLANRGRNYLRRSEISSAKRVSLHGDFDLEKCIIEDFEGFQIIASGSAKEMDDLASLLQSKPICEIKEKTKLAA